MKKKVFGLMIAIVAMLTAFVTGFSQERKAYAIENIEKVSSFYLYRGNSVDSSNAVEVGKTSGYGYFKVGSLNAKLETDSNLGYKVVGWNIKYTEQNKEDTITLATTIPSDANEYMERKDLVLKDKDGVEVNLTVTYFDTNQDGEFDNSTFELSKVFEHLVVEPLFDYIYYKVQVDDVAEILCLDTNNFVAYASSSATDNGITTYNDAIIYENEHYYFYDELKYGKINAQAATETYYTVQDGVNVDYSYGYYTLDENVALTFAIGSNVDVDKNLDFNSASIYADNVNVANLIEYEAGLTDGYFKVGETFYGASIYRTNSIEVNFRIAECKSKVNEIRLDYDNLYIMSFSVYIDAIKQTDAEKINQIMSVTTIANGAKILENEHRYFVKTSSDNQGRSASVYCADKFRYQDPTSGIQYDYYEFSQIDNQTIQNKAYSTISSDFNVDIKYTSIMYTVFLSSGGTIIEEIPLKRGESVDLDNSHAPDCIGYTFDGFTLDEVATSGDENLTVSIHETLPENKIVYLCYDKIDYTLTLNNFNLKSLTDANSQTIYPINEIFLSKSGNLVEKISQIDENGLMIPHTNVSTLNQFTFTTKFNIGDTFTFGNLKEGKYVIKINDGFASVKFSLTDGGTILDEINQEITEDFITTYITAGNNINIYVTEEYSYYNLIYKINPTSNGVAEVIMAEIATQITKYSANGEDDSNNEIVVTKYDKDDVEIVAGSSEEVAKIKIEKLKMYDIVKMSSKGFVIPETTDNYVFNIFKVNDIFELSGEIDSDNITHFYNHEITQDVEVLVIYSTPSSMLRILFAEEYVENLPFGSYVVYHGAEILTKDAQTGAYNIDMGVSGNVKLEVLGMSFGYNIKQFLLNGSTNNLFDVSKSDNLSTCSFTPSPAVTYELFVEIERIKYDIYISQYGGGLNNGTKVEFAPGVDYAELDIENRTISFEKPKGYYISSTSLLLNGDNYNAMNETNEIRNNVDIVSYSYTFEEEEFVNFVTNYAVNNTVEMKIVYENFKYSIEVKYIIDGLNQNHIGKISYPSLVLKYTFDNWATSVESLGVYQSKTYSVLFENNVPYGSTISVSVNAGAPYGMRFKYWTDGVNELGADYHTKNQNSLISNTTMSGDRVLGYVINFVSYTLSLNYDANQGSPIVTKNSQTVDISKGLQISLFDSLEIQLNATKLNGYVPKSVEYRSYLPYSYTSEESWELDKGNLYIIENGVYSKNSNPTYDDTLNYFILGTTEIESPIYTIDSFDIANYVLETGGNGATLIFWLNYSLMEMSIVNVSFDHSASDAEKIFRGGAGEHANNIPVSEYAIYTISAEDGESVRGVDENGKVTIQDVVTITIQINKNALSSVEGFGSKYYDLTNGLILKNTITIAGVDISTILGSSFESVVGEKGKYVLSFPVKDIIDKIDEKQLIITINYVYEIEKKSVEMTTNITTESFYMGINLLISESEYGFGNSKTSNNRKSKVANNMFFLSKAKMSYTLTGEGYSQYFQITTFKAYLKDTNKEIPKEEFTNYGIETITKKSTIDQDVISAIVVRYMHNLKIELQITTIMYVDDNVVIAKDYEFKRTFECDSNGVGKEQRLSIGSGSGYDISVAKILEDKVNLTYTNAAGMSANPINVGIYNVDINFVETPGYEWVSEIVLPYAITLKIQRKPIAISSISVPEKGVIERTYNASSEMIVKSEILDYLVFTDGKDLEILYKDIKSRNDSFQLVMAQLHAKITLMINGEEVEQKNVSPTLYDITIYGLELTNSEFNGNFTLTNEFNKVRIKQAVKITPKVLELEGLEVYDKVYDGTVSVSYNKTPEYINLRGIVGSDSVRVNLESELLKIEFEDANVGANKRVRVNAQGALEGYDCANYILNESYITNKTIYPYSVEVSIGENQVITIYNDRGLTDKDKVNLIPLNAQLKVEIIRPDTREYVSIYKHISKYLQRTKGFAVGYKISFMVYGEEEKVSNQLFLSVPKESDLAQMVYLTGEMSGEINYSTQGNNVNIDLSQINQDISYIIATKRVSLLTWWQILLIVLLVVLIIVTIVIIFLIFRRKKKEKYEVHDVI